MTEDVSDEVRSTLTEEVRVAMALNGGISLAIWMDGCAVELDAARRAHLAEESLGWDLDDGAQAQSPRGRAKRFLLGTPLPAPTPPQVLGTRHVYHELCRAFRRELVIDLMSGASAGGVNGAMLGCATTHHRRLHPDFVRRKWLELGDISLLLQRTSKPDPRSLMRGCEFHVNLRNVFEALTGGSSADALDRAQTALPAEQAVTRTATDGLVPWLDVTTTDLQGTERTYADAWGVELVAREYRARFRFREQGDYTAATLAAATRSSASFPFAFEPWQVDGTALELATFATRRHVIDGGVLDNAPIEVVLDLIPVRPAERQVKRYVCYMNADPPVPDGAKAAIPNSSGSAPSADVEETCRQADPEPSLFGLAKSVLSLPRKAPFVDELDAVERRTRRAALVRETELVLLGEDEAALEALASTLLPVYRERRRLLSLEELLVQPATVRAAWANLPGTDATELPWVPRMLEQDPSRPWGWGLRAAQRAIHLLLDALRFLIVEAQRAGDPARVVALLRLRGELTTEHLAALKVLREGLLGADGTEVRAKLRAISQGQPAERIVGSLTTAWMGFDAEASQQVRAAASVIADGLAAIEGGDGAEPLGGQSSIPLANALFGEGREVETFIRRARYVEVIRRAFESDVDIDPAQEVGFAQLTPFTKVPIFLPSCDGTCPDSPSDKLAGIQLGHFAAFYRRSWRANDYMWGRLDASTRIVELLVDCRRARELAGYPGDLKLEPWTSIAALLLPSDAVTPDTSWLVREMVVDLDGETPQERQQALALMLQEDLQVGDGSLTRLLCTRAVQLEILEAELPVLDETSRVDAALGASSKPLDLPLANLHDAVKAVRHAAGEATLPARLGARGKHEIGSTLGLRVATHALFVALAALRFAKVPLAKPLYALRAVLFPVAGATSRVGWYRAVVAVGFWAAALYVTSRIVTTPTDGGTDLESVGWSSVLVSGVALLAILALAAIPAVRVYTAGPKNWGVRSIQLFWAVGLAAAGGVLAIGLALGRGMSTTQLLLSPGADEPWGWLRAALIAIVFGLPIARVSFGVRARLYALLARRQWVGPALAGGFLALSCCLAAWAISGPLWPRLIDDDPAWKVVVEWAAVPFALIVAGGYLANSHPAAGPARADESRQG